jgi:small acid-soluble spore protein (thioredoxin-like protein)
MKHTHNPDNRTNDEERVKTTINKTMHNNEVADEIINKTNDSKLKETLREKNDRRKVALNDMKREIRDE